jgi:hypothetical protein
LVILVLVYFTQVSDAVVAGVLIDMINVFRWKGAIFVKPRQTMGFIQRIVDADDYVAIFVCAARYAAF